MACLTFGFCEPLLFRIMQSRRFFVLKFWCREKAELFQTDADRLKFLRLFEKEFRPYISTYAWGFTNTQAFFLLSVSYDPDRVMDLAERVMKKYNRSFTSFHRQRLKLQKKLLHLSQPDETQLQFIVTCIHSGPLLQGLGSNFVEYPWTSYLMLIDDKVQSWLKAEEVMGWFESKESYRAIHHSYLNKKLEGIESYRGNFITFI